MPFSLSLSLSVYVCLFVCLCVCVTCLGEGEGEQSGGLRPLALATVWADLTYPGGGIIHLNHPGGVKRCRYDHQQRIWREFVVVMMRGGRRGNENQVSEEDKEPMSEQSSEAVTFESHR